MADEVRAVCALQLTYVGSEFYAELQLLACYICTTSNTAASRLSQGVFVGCQSALFYGAQGCSKQQYQQRSKSVLQPRVSAISHLTKRSSCRWRLWVQM